jgi:hypothetical protein
MAWIVENQIAASMLSLFVQLILRLLHGKDEYCVYIRKL